jgi:hypothetical protein
MAGECCNHAPALVSGGVKLQVAPFRYPEFPVELSGLGELHAAFFTERRTRGLGWRRYVGNPGTPQAG